MIIKSQSDDRIVIKNNAMFTGIGIAAVGMTVAGISLLVQMLPLRADYDVGDTVGFVFLCVWSAVVAWMSITALNISSQRIIMDQEGITCKSWFTKASLSWSEIGEWGLSYTGQTRYEGSTYYLYFSKDQRPNKNEYAKKLRGTKLKSFVIGREYDEVVHTLIPFCASKTSVKPFLGGR